MTVRTSRAGLAAGFGLVLLAGVLVVVTRGSSCPAFAMTVGSRVNPNGSGEGVPRVNVVLTDAHLHVLRALTNDDSSNEAAISPDGRRVAYASGRGYPSETETGREGSRIRVMDIDGRHDRAVTDGYDDYPTWAPDGSALAFIRRTQPNQIWRVDLATGHQSMLAVARLPSSIGGGLRWLRDGRIVFSTDESGWSIPASGGTPTRIARVSPYTEPLFSPDGSRYALNAAVHGEPIRVVDMRSGRSIDVPRSNTQLAQPLLWTDQGRLVFIQNVRGADINVVSWRPGDTQPTLLNREQGIPIDLADNPACAP